MKSLLTKVFKKANKQNSSAGFTLIELLVAASITTIVIGLTGFGVVAITSKNKEAKAESERRVELNRALDFITDEVRQAKPIATDADADLSIVAPGFNSSGKTPVLTLQIPGVSQRVIYYIALSSSSWLGPNVIYRWGPNFSSNGQYLYPDNNPPIGCGSFNACNPRNWTYEPLVDLIVDTAPSSTPTCPNTNWSLNPPSSITGFYACIDSSGRIADIHLRGKLTDAYNNSRPPLEVSTKTFARPYTPTFTTGIGGGSGLGGGGSTGRITITQPSTAYFEYLGGDIACTGGLPIPTTTTVNFTAPGETTSTPNTLPSTGNRFVNLSAPVGSTLTVTGTLSSSAANNSCSVSGEYNSATHNYDTAAIGSRQVMTLRNGDTPPLFSPYGSGKTIKSYLQKYVNSSTGKVSLADNQVIFLFELVAINQSDSYYDMQDQVVLATIVPKG